MHPKPLKSDGFLAVAAKSGNAYALRRLQKGGQPISLNPKGSRPAGRSLWLLAVAVAVLAGVAVPYGLLAGRETGLAVVSFWLLFGLVVIGLVALGVLRWRDEP